VSNEQYADVREMYMAHNMFRREFGLLPALIAGVDAADVARVRIVAEHFALIHAGLHHHHSAEDMHLWPALSRAGEKAAPVAALMESQHRGMDKVLTEITTGLQSWQETADKAQGTAQAASAERLRQLLTEHLVAEEEQALPLMTRYVTAAEWSQMLTESVAGIPADELVLLLGLMIYEGDPEVVNATIENTPPAVRPVIGGLATEAFARHAELVYGTPTPTKSTEL
jgi:hemerythrin-like domain-containing protein